MINQSGNVSSQSIIQPKVHLSLDDPRLTVLHQAGLAGLWMTLKQVEKQHAIAAQRPGKLTWILSPDSILLDWEGSDFSALDWLLKQSFQINNDGLINLTGLAPQTIDLQTRLIIHQGITGTFLQHNKFLQSAGKETTDLKIDGKQITVEYKRVVSYIHQSAAALLCDQQGDFLQKPVSIAGWLYPGAVVRHARFGEKTKFEESPELALTLIFAPVACWYFILSKPSQRGLEYALVIPEIDDLEQYALHSWQLRNLDYLSFYASGMGEVGLKFLIQQTVLDGLKTSPSRRCQVVLFGQTDWSSQQKSRLGVISLEATREVLAEYQASCEIFESNRIIEYPSWQLIIPSYARRIITENLAKGHLWWSNLFESINDQAALQEISREWEGLFSMLENTQWDNEAEKLFVRACHEALRRTYAKIYSRTPEDEYAKIEQKNQRFLSDLNRCKDGHTFRHFINSFFAKAGLNSFLEEHWEELLPLVTGETDWRISRDLMLLAMASYPRSKVARTKQAGDGEGLLPTD